MWIIGVLRTDRYAQKKKTIKKIFVFLIVAIIATSQAFGQCACCAGAGVGSSNGDWNNGVFTLPKKGILIETYADYRTVQDGAGHHSENDSMTVDEETPLKSLLISSLGLRYGLSKKITVAALMPYAFLFTDKGNDKGIGDLILLGTYNAYSKNNLNIAVQGGVELPTGIQKGSNFDNTTVVVGSGSVDPILGVMMSKRWRKWSIQANALYKYTTNGFGGVNYGSLSVQNLAVSYRLKGDQAVLKTDTSNTSTRSTWNLTFTTGYYGEWLAKINDNGTVDDNTGYYLGFGTVSANFSFKKWMLPLTFSLPLINGVNGDQNHSGFRLRIGLIRTF